MNNYDLNKRYSRQIPILGTLGQKSIQTSTVVIIGVGGLGCPAALYLNQSGVGQITLVDPDNVELSNLHRQVIFTEKDIGKNKAEAAKNELTLRNSGNTINAIPKKLTADNANDILKNADIVLDCSDNFTTRYLINEYSRKLEKPLISASIYHDEGMISTFNYRGGACLECLFPSPPPLAMIPNCSELGVLGTDVGIIGLLQAKEVINVILQKPKLNSRVMTISLDNLSFKIKNIHPICKCIPGSLEDSSTNTQLKNINYFQLCDVIENDKNAQLIDIRSPSAHLNNNIGGINIPYNELEKNIKNLNKSEPIILYCKTGQTSAHAAQYLLSKGFLNVLNLTGGIDNLSPCAL
jgi:molybdopterin/thiamine biosynthesis adenylyltransferase/rhodanese-related sulfurtransferase